MSVLKSSNTFLPSSYDKDKTQRSLGDSGSYIFTVLRLALSTVTAECDPTVKFAELLRTSNAWQICDRD
jgi:hypothetical protein